MFINFWRGVVVGVNRVGFAGFVFTLVVFVLNLVGSLLLIRGFPAKMQALVFLGLVTLVGIISLVGLKLNNRWGWPVAVVSYSLLLAYGSWLLYVVGGAVLPLLLVFLAVAGLLVALIAVDLWEPEPVFTEQPSLTEPLEQLADEVLPTKKSRKKVKK